MKQFFKKFWPTIIILAFGAALLGMFFTFPEKEPNRPFRWFEMSVIALVTISGIIAARAWQKRRSRKK